MTEIITFLKSLLSRKLALAIAAFIVANQPSIPPRYQAIATAVIAGLYFIANVAEKKVAPDAPPSIDADALAAQVEAQTNATTDPPAGV